MERQANSPHGVGVELQGQGHPGAIAHVRQHPAQNRVAGAQGCRVLEPLRLTRAYGLGERVRRVEGYAPGCILQFRREADGICQLERLAVGSEQSQQASDGAHGADALSHDDSRHLVDCQAGHEGCRNPLQSCRTLQGAAQLAAIGLR